MFNLLHNFHPQPIILSLGPIHIYWYGLMVVLGILAGLFVILRLAKLYSLDRETIFDLAFWLIIFGLIGARLYDVCLNLAYYFAHPLYVLEVWRGGLAIHGAVIAGLLVVIVFARRQKIDFWRLTALFVPGLALGQAIGRWGNYFNQEIFGRPTLLPWGIPIDLVNRPAGYLDFQFFQPTFLYESLGCLLIFALLLSLTIYFARRGRLKGFFYVWLTLIYMILYSILRFLIEFIRLDPAPYLFGLRWPQIMSLLLIVLSAVGLIYYSHDRNKATQ